MKYLKTYKIFESEDDSVSNWMKIYDQNLDETSEYLKDICWELKDDGFTICGGSTLKSLYDDHVEDIISLHSYSSSIEINRFDGNHWMPNRMFSISEVYDTITTIINYMGSRGYKTSVYINSHNLLKAESRTELNDITPIINAIRTADSKGQQHGKKNLQGLGSIRFIKLYFRKDQNSKHLESYKVFESANPTKDFFNDKINWELIDSLKDMCYDYLDEGGKLLYRIEIDTDDPYRDLVVGSFFTREETPDPNIEASEIEKKLFDLQQKVIPKDHEHFINLYGDNLKKAIVSWEESKRIRYGFKLYKFGYYGQQREDDKQGTLKVLNQLKNMYPDEKIYTE